MSSSWREPPQVGEELDEEHALGKSILVGWDRIVNAADTDAIESDNGIASLEEQSKAVDARRGPTRTDAPKKGIRPVGAAASRDRNIVVVPIASEEDDFIPLELPILGFPSLDVRRQNLRADPIAPGVFELADIDDRRWTNEPVELDLVQRHVPPLPCMGKP